MNKFLPQSTRLQRSASFLALLLTLFGTATAQATTRYSYEGNAFSVFIESAEIAGAYTSDMRFSGYFETASPLASSMDSMDIQALITAFEFSDGRNTRVLGDPLTTAIRVATGATGAIDSWFINLLDAPSGPLEAGDQFSQLISFSDDVDLGAILQCNEVLNDGFCNSATTSEERGLVGNDPGTWSVTTVPLPGGLGIFVLALAMLGRRYRSSGNGAHP